MYPLYRWFDKLKTASAGPCVNREHTGNIPAGMICIEALINAAFVQLGQQNQSNTTLFALFVSRHHDLYQVFYKKLSCYKCL